jgi:hypothetical protein
MRRRLRETVGGVAVALLVVVLVALALWWDYARAWLFWHAR